MADRPRPREKRVEGREWSGSPYARPIATSPLGVGLSAHLQRDYSTLSSLVGSAGTTMIGRQSRAPPWPPLKLAATEVRCGIELSPFSAACPSGTICTSFQPDICAGLLSGTSAAPLSVGLPSEFGFADQGRVYGQPTLIGPHIASQEPHALHIACTPVDLSSSHQEDFSHVRLAFRRPLELEMQFPGKAGDHTPGLNEEGVVYGTNCLIIGSVRESCLALVSCGNATWTYRVPNPVCPAARHPVRA
ncbi:hypothetical protein THAOC_05250 [Thalassiosira oceanica]|uniref:Uncharacterized protein n=1 Tax=Thalassiosira oceanica TaxID=159749 RepID=K0T7T5_THAOC|nr:hypothetical protein THAOC_05250 [Thalassiosira oceanica]|eukprot:EJK73144.1 hypothetical protein THAOC_05250 [Thalassiosira oceanica]